MRGSYGRYRVIGTRIYRGHGPGEEFIAQIPPRTEARLEGRIFRLLERVTPQPPAGWWLPQGWCDGRIGTANSGREG